MSRHDDNAAAFTDLVADALVHTRGWSKGEKVDEGLVMNLPDGGTRLLVTRVWHFAVCNNDYAQKAAHYAAHGGQRYGGAVLAVTSTLGDLGRAYVEPFLQHNLEVFDEPVIAGLAGEMGVGGLERYAFVLREMGHGRDILPRDKWAKPARQGMHPVLHFTGADVKAMREEKGMSLFDARAQVVHDRLKAGIAHLRTDRDFDLLVDLVEMLVDNVTIKR